MLIKGVNLETSGPRFILPLLKLPSPPLSMVPEYKLPHQRMLQKTLKTNLTSQIMMRNSPEDYKSILAPLPTLVPKADH